MFAVLNVTATTLLFLGSTLCTVYSAILVFSCVHIHYTAFRESIISLTGIGRVFIRGLMFRDDDIQCSVSHSLEVMLVDVMFTLCCSTYIAYKYM